MTDPVSPRLLATFVEEVQDQVRQLNRDLLALEGGDRDAETLRSLFRVGHTVKGAARVVGAEPLEELCHAFESYFAAARDGEVEVEAAPFPVLFATADALSAAAEALRASQALDTERLGTLARLLRDAADGEPLDPGEVDAVAAAPPEEEATSTPAPDPAAAEPAGGGEGPSGAPSTDPGAGEGSREEAAPAEDGEGSSEGTDRSPATPPPEGDDWSHVRIRSSRLDVLLASTLELGVTSGRSERTAREVAGLHRRLDHWLAGWREASEELRGSMRRSGAGLRAQGLVRDLDEGLNLVAREAGRIAQEAASDARLLDRSTAELAHVVHRVRVRPVGDAFETLPRAARDVARTEGKEVDLLLEGGDVEADRLVVDTLREPLLHLVRNAVSHGIETPEVRREAGKPVRGTVRVVARRSGDRLVVSVSDDGAGVDVDEVRRRLAASGARVPDDDGAVVRALFSGGVSTRDEASEISGRGVGLNLVDAAMERIRGHVDVRWNDGAGTTFELVCPPSPSTVQAVLVEVGSETFALPTWSVTRLVRVPREAIHSMEGRAYLRHGDGHVPLVSLAEVLGPPLEAGPPDGFVTAVLVEDAGGGAALSVDALLDSRELVTRPFRRCGAELPHLAGGALLPSGEVTLVLDVREILARVASTGAGEALAAPETAGRARQRILVADDSLTTRSLEQSVLEAAGYDVVTAVDGMDAWRRLQDESVDLVVSDVEMPRMDGFDLCRRVRSGSRTRNLPVILVTGLETPEQRERGLDAGADAYMGKSTFEQDELLDVITRLLGPA